MIEYLPSKYEPLSLVLPKKKERERERERQSRKLFSVFQPYPSEMR
jgi:hypothetical protein